MYRHDVGFLQKRLEVDAAHAGSFEDRLRHVRITGEQICFPWPEQLREPGPDPAETDARTRNDQVRRVGAN